MDYQKIKHQLDNYFEGNSSLAEEKELKEFFRYATFIPEELLYAKAIFAQLDEEVSVRFDKEVHYDAYNMKFWFRWTSIAASLLFVVGVFYYTTSSNATDTYAIINGRSVTNQAEAMRETRKALLLITNNLNQGTEGLSHLSKLNEVEQLISKDKKK